ncbi:MAG: thioredoxin domain-containing protein, partial [Hyphomonadaceae bacterium]
MRVLGILMMAIAALVFVAPSQAVEYRSFTSEAFAQAQAEGQPILVEVHADWCPTCRAQAPAVRRAAAAPEFNELVIFTLDFDRQTSERRALGVRAQSTLIAFNGRAETARSVGETDPG